MIYVSNWFNIVADYKGVYHRVVTKAALCTQWTRLRNLLIDRVVVYLKGVFGAPCTAVKREYVLELSSYTARLFLLSSQTTYSKCSEEWCYKCFKLPKFNKKICEKKHSYFSSEICVLVHRTSVQMYIVHLYSVQAQSYNGVQCTICRYNILTVYCNCTMYTNYAVKCSTYSLTTLNIVRSYNCAVTVQQS